MPSALHQAIVEALRERPDLVCELGRRVERRIPTTGRIEVNDSKLADISPPDYSADLVVLVGPKEKRRFGLVVEVQLGIAEDKRYSWPLYVATLRARHRCPCCVLVLAPDPKVAAWAARPIDVGQPRSPFVPLVLGAGGVPAVTDVEAARRRPELAMFSAIFHQDNEAVARAAIAGVRSLFAVDEERGTRYYDVIAGVMSNRVLALLEAEMATEGYQYVSEFARKHVAEGREIGRQEGRAAEAVRAVLAVFEARELLVPAEVRDQIAACKDLDLLALWLKRAVKVGAAAEIFDQ
jgi:hypothetical protein